jgi:hypothetical protein
VGWRHDIHTTSRQNERCNIRTRKIFIQRSIFYNYTDPRIRGGNLFSEKATPRIVPPIIISSPSRVSEWWPVGKLPRKKDRARRASRSAVQDTPVQAAAEGDGGRTSSQGCIIRITNPLMVAIPSTGNARYHRRASCVCHRRAVADTACRRCARGLHRPAGDLRGGDGRAPVTERRRRAGCARADAARCAFRTRPRPV